MRRVITFFLVVVVLAGMAAVGTRHLLDRPNDPSEATLHRWLHDKLDLTAEQRIAIEKSEEQFASEEKRLRENLNEANRQLARAMREDKAYTPRVAEAVEKVHHCMGEMQKLSIAHLFEMGQHLDERQNEALLRYAEMALTDAQ